MKLAQLYSSVQKLAELEIKGITNDSRKVEEGFIYVNTSNNAEYDAAALKNGAAVVFTSINSEYENVVLVEDTARVFAEISAKWHGNPAHSLKLIGVTGTNGKTSVTYMLKAILEKSGKKVGLIGTNNNMIGQKVVPSINTTPNAYHLHQLFAQMKAQNCEYVVMEVSSHSLTNGHIIGLTFDAGIFTNLTRDHLDFHGSMEAYFGAKKKLFDVSRLAILNADDEYFELLNDEVNYKKVSYGVGTSADYIAKAVNTRATSNSYELLCDGLYHVDVNTGGNFTVYNSLAAIACAKELGIGIETILSALKEFSGVKGRAEVVPDTGDYTVIIDYAHTPDGLKNILKTFKNVAKNRLIVLFGCGGDRDNTKRALMGEIASIYADYVIVTTDNPRTEDPSKIIEEIVSGIPSGMFRGKIIEDRQKAIKFALSIAQKDDIIILAGKGHETYQILGKEKVDFDEREIIRHALSELA